MFPCEFDISRNNFGLSDSDLTNSASHRGERSGVGGALLVLCWAEALLTPAPLPQVHVDFAAKVDATEPHHSIHISGMNKRNSISILIICVYIYRKKIITAYPLMEFPTTQV